MSVPVTMKTSGRFGIVVSRFNEDLTRRLLEGAVAVLRRRGIGDDQVDTVWVPGAFEIPVAVHRLATSGRYRALIALGAVIRGATRHYEAICQTVSHGVADTARTTGVPVGFGVIMATRRAEAEARACLPVRQAGGRWPEGRGAASFRGGRWNLGSEAAEVATAMAEVMESAPCASGARRASTR